MEQTSCIQLEFEYRRVAYPHGINVIVYNLQLCFRGPTFVVKRFDKPIPLLVLDPLSGMGGAGGGIRPQCTTLVAELTLRPEYATRNTPYARNLSNLLVVSFFVDDRRKDGQKHRH